MTYVALAIFLLLGTVAALHVGWAFGMVWPAKDPQSLASMVIGQPDLQQVPGRPLTLGVALAIFAAALCAPWAAGLISLPLPDWMATLSPYVLALIFTARGIATYIPNGPLSNTVEPFHSLDWTYFAPLCLLLAAGYASIALNGLLK